MGKPEKEKEQAEVECCMQQGFMLAMHNHAGEDSNYKELGEWNNCCDASKPNCTVSMNTFWEELPESGENLLDQKQHRFPNFVLKVT